MAVPKLKKAQGNSASTTLSSAVSDSATSMPLTSDTNFAGEGMVIAAEGTANEEFAYASTKAGSSLTTPLINRGLEGTSAAGHDSGTSVKGVLTVSMWNDLIDSLLNVLDQTTGVVDTTKVVTLTGTQALTNKTLTSAVLNTGVSGTAVLDEDNMASNSATKVATQQSIKAYVDTAVAGAGSTDGWISTADTWTYASASTFTIAGVDRTAQLSKGTRLKFTQTTAKYAVVVSSSFSTNTTVTIMVNTDYTIANAAITSPSYSYAMNPQGYPGWFAMAAPSFTVAEIDDGAGGQPTTSQFRGRVDGNMFTAHLRGSGTKAGTASYFSWSNSGMPAIANSTERSAIGHAFIWNSGGTPDHFLAVVSRISTADYFLSDASMADNKVIDSLGVSYSYEI